MSLSRLLHAPATASTTGRGLCWVLLPPRGDFRAGVMFASSHSHGEDPRGGLLGARGKLVDYLGDKLHALIEKENPDRHLPPEMQDNPGFISKIVLRFKGIPLKGEPEKPRSFVDDLDKTIAMPVHPDVPKSFKEHPDRDLVNFPYPLRPMYPPKTRMTVFPDSWFHPFYKITGVTGPYLFLFGVYAFLTNKAILVMDENWIKIFQVWIPLYIIVTRIFGYRIEKWRYGMVDDYLKEHEKYKQEETDAVAHFRAESTKMSDSLKAMKEQFPTIIKENMALQLEAVYRKNASNLAAEVKRRLDYLQETEATKRRFEREHQLKWISNAVREQISTNKDGIKDRYMDECITALKGLSLRPA